MPQLLFPAMAAALAAIGIPLAQGEQPQNPAIAPGASSTPDATTPVDLLKFETDQKRMTVPVSIGAKGPYRFVIDTGAERSVVSRELAGSLNLASGRRIRVTTMTGTSDLGTFLLPEVRAGSVSPATLEAPVVEASNLGAVGMLGLDALQGHTVLIDFDKNVMEVRTATRKQMQTGPDDVIVRAKNVYGQLIVTNAHYRDRKIAVVIDTGSPISIGNTALLRRVRTEKSLGEIRMLSVTGQYLTADYRVIDQIEIAGIEFHSIPLAFAEALPFKRFGLSDTPALMLGMDTLRLFRRVQIDFANREVRFTLPKSAVNGAFDRPF